MRDEFLDHLTEGLKYGVIIDAGEIETENKQREMSLINVTYSFIIHTLHPECQEMIFKK